MEDETDIISQHLPPTGNKPDDPPESSRKRESFDKIPTKEENETDTGPEEIEEENPGVELKCNESFTEPGVSHGATEEINSEDFQTITVETITPGTFVDTQSENMAIQVFNVQEGNIIVTPMNPVTDSSPVRTSTIEWQGTDAEEGNSTESDVDGFLSDTSDDSLSEFYTVTPLKLSGEPVEHDHGNYTITEQDTSAIKSEATSSIKPANSNQSTEVPNQGTNTKISETILDNEQSNQEVPCEYKCGRCGSLFDDWQSIALHLYSCKRDHVCSKCDLPFLNNKQLEKHMKSNDCVSDAISCTTMSHNDDTDESPIISIKVSDVQLPKKNKNTPKKKKTKTRKSSGPSSKSSDGNIPCQYKCGKCGRLFDNWRAISVHRHSCSQDYVCITCGLPFLSQKMLTLHQKSHQESHMKQCPICNKSYRRQHFKDHLQTHSLLTCGVCKKQFKGQRNLRVHLQDHVDGPYLCQVCNKQYLCKKSYKQHLATHCEDSKKCQYCSIEFLTIKEKSQHAAACALKYDEEKKASFDPFYSCLKCGRKFTYKRSVTQHHCVPLRNLVELDKSTVPLAPRDLKVLADVEFIESEVDKKISEKTKSKIKVENSKSSRKHRKAKVPAPQEKVYYSTVKTVKKFTPKESMYCKTCNVTFTKNHSYEQHVAQCSTEMPCPDGCGKFFCGLKKLKNHKFNCPANDYKRPSDMFGSRRKQLEEPMTCATCNKQYWHKAHYKEHLESHNMVPCPVCGKQFKGRKNLRDHVKIHSVQGSLSCPICGKQYNSFKGFQAHSREHTTGFNCANCNQHFWTMALMDRHRKQCVRDRLDTLEVAAFANIQT